MVQKRVECYCAYCRTKRKVYKSKYLNYMGVFGILTFSYVLTLAIWEQTDVRGLFILGVSLLLAEGFTQLRWRQSMICQNCGFDAVIYVKDKNLASAKIKAFMKIRENDPKFLLKPLLPIQKQKLSHSSIEINQSKTNQKEAFVNNSNLSLLG